MVPFAARFIPGDSTLRQLITLGLMPLLVMTLFPVAVLATTGSGGRVDLTQSTTGLLALGIFVFAYIVVMAEEFTHLRKSKPVILAAGVIWGMIAWVYAGMGDGDTVEAALSHNLLEFSELFLFLLAAMIYVNAMDERLVFQSLRAHLV